MIDLTGNFAAALVNSGMIQGACYEHGRVARTGTAPGTDGAVVYPGDDHALHLPPEPGNVTPFKVNSPQREWGKGDAPASETGYSIAWDDAAAPPGEWDEAPAAVDAAWMDDPNGQAD